MELQINVNSLLTLLIPAKLGANAILGVSMACTRAAAAEKVYFCKSNPNDREFHFTLIFQTFLDPRSPTFSPSQHSTS
jgi:hypothetical protein